MLHASEQAIQRMFRAQQQQPPNQYSEKPINAAHTYPGPGPDSNKNSFNLRQSFSAPTQYDQSGYNTNPNKVTFSPESLMFTPREKASQGSRSSSNFNSFSSLLDTSNSLNVSSSSSSSNSNAIPTAALSRWEKIKSAFILPIEMHLIVLIDALIAP